MELKLEHKILRELLEQDKELKIKVKQAILETAIKHETWKVLNSQVSGVVNKMVTSELSTYMEKTNWGINIPHGFKTAISSAVSNAITQIIEDKVQRAMSRIEKDLEKIVTDKFKVFITEKLKAMAEELFAAK